MCPPVVTHFKISSDAVRHPGNVHLPLFASREVYIFWQGGCLVDAVNRSYTVQTLKHPCALFILHLIVPAFKQHAQTNYDRLWQVQKFLLLTEYSADDHLFHQIKAGMDINNSLWYYHHLCLSCIFLDCGFICLSFNSRIVWWAVPVGTRTLSL